MILDNHNGLFHWYKSLLWNFNNEYPVLNKKHVNTLMCNLVLSYDIYWDISERISCNHYHFCLCILWRTERQSDTHMQQKHFCSMTLYFIVILREKKYITLQNYIIEASVYNSIAKVQITNSFILLLLFNLWREFEKITENIARNFVKPHSDNCLNHINMINV